MIYEISLLDLSWPLVIVPSAFLFLFSKYIWSHDLLVKKQKVKYLAIASFVLGTFPLCVFVYHLTVNIMNLTGSYSSAEGSYQSISDDGRIATLNITGHRFKFHLYSTSCLSYKPKLTKGDYIKVKYLGEKNDVCILEIQKI
ncbi:MULTISPECIES: hypothetical protein [unclassified Pseudoalteromonas]|uniref:hypothetical protein n=1 Tax=unclassified Pseudoalteromonas TaxID=194690 RepID=UPI00390C9961